MYCTCGLISHRKGLTQGKQVLDGEYYQLLVYLSVCSASCMLFRSVASVEFYQIRFTAAYI